jgi:hypothetical protein
VRRCFWCSHGGRTALILASAKGNLELVEALVAAGADKGTKDKDGKTALLLATEHGHPAVVRALGGDPAEAEAVMERNRAALCALRSSAPIFVAGRQTFPALSYDRQAVHASQTHLDAADMAETKGVEKVHLRKGKAHMLQVQADIALRFQIDLDLGQVQDLVSAIPEGMASTKTPEFEQLVRQVHSSAQVQARLDQQHPGGSESGGEGQVKGEGVDASSAAPSFGSSNFKPAYIAALCPEYQDELLGSMRKIVVDYVSRHDIPQAARKTFIEKLQGEYGSLNESVSSSAQKVWTSKKKLEGREFCSIYGEAIRNDDAALAEPCAVFARALNSRLVARGVSLADQTFPRGPDAGGRDKSTEANVSWRGGGFMANEATRAFFVPGQKYRCAQFLATSFDLAVAHKFIRRVKHNPVVNANVLWKVKLDPERGCDHVNLVEETHVPGESEFLFAAYSAFEVVAVHWSATPQDPTTPHELTIRAAVDNANDPSFPEDLPLAPWC